MTRRLFALCLALLALSQAAMAFAATPASITSPANSSTLSGASQMFQWDAAPGATLYQLWVGNSPGAYDLGYFPAAGTPGTSVTVSGLPVDGRTLYVTLWSSIDGTYYSTASMYAASSGTSAAASITSPMNGATLSGAAQLFQWNAAPGATLYQLWVGNTPGAYDLGYFPAAGTTGTSVTATGLPTDGRAIYVRLYSSIGGAYQFRDFTYTAANVGAVPATIISPAPGSTLQHATEQFQWTNAGASLYQLWAGTSVGGYDLGYSVATTSTSSDLDVPVDGRIIYVRLWSLMGGTYRYNDYTYTAFSAAPPAQPSVITDPADGSQLASATQTFQWNGTSGATLYQLWIGNSAGAYDIGYFPAAGTTATSTNVTNLPTDGRMLHARLWTFMQTGSYEFRDFTFTAAMVAPAEPAEMIYPGAGATLTSCTRPTQTFMWTSPPGATFYQVWVGSEPGGSDLGYFPAAGTTETSTVVTGLPNDGRPVFVRLWSSINGEYQYRDYPYTAPALGDVFMRPPEGSTLPGPNQAFEYSFTTMPNSFTVGNTVGGSDYTAGVGGLSLHAFGLPIDGRALYARVTWQRDGGTHFCDVMYRAAPAGPGAVMLQPPSGEPLFSIGPDAHYSWTDVGATMYRLWLGRSPGGQEAGVFDTTATSATVRPTDVYFRPSHVRLWSLIGGVWYYRDYTYSASFG